MVCALALIGAACGSSSDDKSSGGDSSGGSSGFSSPLKIVGFWEVQGESTVAISDFENAAQMALADINDNGGVGGKDVEYERVANPVLDEQKSVSAYLKALDADPSVVIGGGGSTNAISTQVARGGVPLISPDTNQNVEFGAKQGSDTMWLFSGGQAEGWQDATKFAVQELDAKKIGFMGYTFPFGAVARTAVTAEAKKLGAEVVADEQIELGGDDLTPAILQMKGADIIFNASYQNDNALQLRQTYQNALGIPSMFQGGLTIAANQKLVEGPALEGSYAFTDCDPLGTSADMTEFRDAYAKKYGSSPSYLSAVTWDLMHFTAEAAKVAKSSDAEKINAAIPKTSYDGICQKDIHADKAHLMFHSPQILKFNGGGTWTSVKTYTDDDKTKGGS